MVLTDRTLGLASLAARTGAYYTVTSLYCPDSPCRFQYSIGRPEKYLNFRQSMMALTPDNNHGLLASTKYIRPPFRLFRGMGERLTSTVVPRLVNPRMCGKHHRHFDRPLCIVWVNVVDQSRPFSPYIGLAR